MLLDAEQMGGTKLLRWRFGCRRIVERMRLIEISKTRKLCVEGPAKRLVGLPCLRKAKAEPAGGQNVFNFSQIAGRA